MTALLDIAAVSRTFGGVHAVEDVSFSVAEGTATALIGPNGAGKTTLFNVITNLIPPSAGSVKYRGEPIGHLPTEEIARMGLVRTFQTARVFPGMTVLENVAVGAHRLLTASITMQMVSSTFARLEEERIRARADVLLDIVGLSSQRDRAATELPMGAQKLVEVIRALMSDPKLLLLDEPAAGLNDTETAELLAMLSALREAGITLLVVEHNMSLVMGLADQIVVLDAGRTVAIGPPHEIRNNRAVINAYVGSEDV